MAPETPREIIRAELVSMLFFGLLFLAVLFI